MAFQQAQIPVQKLEEFEQLKAVLERVLAAGSAEAFFRKLQSRGLQVRQLEKVLTEGIFEQADLALSQSGKTAKSLYDALAVSDQALMREFYLERIEQVDPAVRGKFQKLYRYY